MNRLNYRVFLNTEFLGRLGGQQINNQICLKLKPKIFLSIYLHSIKKRLENFSLKIYQSPISLYRALIERRPK